jgi:hypothetical protein
MVVSRVIIAVVFCALMLSASLKPQARQAIESDINVLYGTDPDIVKTQAANRLVAVGPSAIPMLVPVICDRSKPNFNSAWPFAAKALGQLRAEPAAHCLVNLLGLNFPPIGPVFMKSDETIARADPAFAALVQIGEPAVSMIRYELPFLGPENAYEALRVLRLIKTPSAKEAVDTYIKTLNRQVGLANKILDGWNN